MRQIEKDILTIGMFSLLNNKSLKSMIVDYDGEKIIELMSAHVSEENIEEKMKQYANEVYARLKKKFKKSS